jgi:site-specific DNA-methyltransferase (adenine-specific)
LHEIVRILKPGGAFFLYNLPKWNMRLGAWLCQYLDFKHWIAVDIKFSLPIPGRLYPSHYALLYFTKGPRPRRFTPPRVPIETCRHCGGELKDYGGYKDKMNPLGVNISDVWGDLSPVRHSRFKRRKANELPLKMMDRILDIASGEGDLVFDPFGGSGTTYVAAELKGRRWLGCEIGDCQPIIGRFALIEQDRELLEKIRTRVNVLFTDETLRLRSRNGHETSKYRIDANGPARSLRGSQASLFEYR